MTAKKVMGRGGFLVMPPVAWPGHLGNMAMAVGRKIRFNPDTEEIIGDPEASKLLGSPMRAPWRLQVG